MANELDKLEEFIACKVSYAGEGKPHFMRRQLDDGQELVILASVEDDEEIQITIQNKNNF